MLLKTPSAGPRRLGSLVRILARRSMGAFRQPRGRPVKMLEHRRIPRKCGSQARVFQGHTDAILSASFSPDGQQIIQASARPAPARLWDLSLARELRASFPELYQYLATRAVFFPNGETMLTAAGDNTACIWDATTGTQRLRLEPTGRRRSGFLDGRLAQRFSPEATIGP